MRSSGKQLNDGIEGIFTYDGFHNVFLPEAVSVAERVHREAWVLGEQNEAAQNQAALLKLSRDVLDLYYNDYISRYDQLLGDIDIIPLESLSHAVEVTNVLSGPTSPIVNILTEVSNETRLNEDKSVLDSGSLAEGAQNVAAIEARSNLSIQGQILLEALVNSAANAPGQAAKPPGAYVQERFQWLYDLVNRPEGQPSQLDDLMGQLQLVYQELNKMSFSGVATRRAERPGAAAVPADRQPDGRAAAPLGDADFGGLLGHHLRRHAGVDQRALAIGGAAVLRKGAGEPLPVQPLGARRRGDGGFCQAVFPGRHDRQLLQ